jgi:acyl dehydratase
MSDNANPTKRPVRGLYFEDFKVGMELVTPARTITAADITNFCCLTGDFNEVHANIEYAKTTPFGDVIAHGPMVYGIAGGLQYASGINDGTLLALLQIDKWQLKAPVMAGDTIHMRQTVVEKKPTSKPDRGVVKLKREIVNQRGETVQEMETTILYRTRAGAA